MSSSPSKTKTKRILIVDDEPDVTFTLKKGLENNGMFEVDTFNDPLEVLSNFQRNYYDFLLIDVKMPHMGGYDFYDNTKPIEINELIRKIKS
jgi:two-component system, OmpR family, response regulator ChvI